MKKIIISIITLTTALIISISVYANNNAQNAIALENLDATSGRAICYSQFVLCDTMRCLRCVTCDYDTGIGVTKGGYCKTQNSGTTIVTL